MAVVGLSIVILGIIYVSWPVGHIPPYDANLTRLAETERQGYCAGYSFINSQGEPNPGRVRGCRKKNMLSDKPNLIVVQKAFCQGVVDGGWEGNVNQCLLIMGQEQYWPTYDGGITNAWNRARPYPLTFLPTQAQTGGDNSRTGNHNGSERSNNPSHLYP